MYFDKTPVTDKNKEELLDDIFSVAIDVDLGVDESIHLPGVMLRDSNDRMIGASWYEITDDNEFNFHIATTPEYQGRGIGEKIVVLTLDLYNDLKKDNPDLGFKVNVINQNLMRLLFRYNIMVQEDKRHPRHPFDDVFLMRFAPPRENFIAEAARNDPKAYFSAMNNGAEHAGLPTDKFITLFHEWASESLATLPEKQTNALRNTLLELPINQLHQHYLWEQLNKDAGQKIPFPKEHHRPLTENDMKRYIAPVVAEIKNNVDVIRPTMRR
jgi:GNAT superfamily N-acetyltransferase